MSGTGRKGFAGDDRQILFFVNTNEYYFTYIQKNRTEKAGNLLTFSDEKEKKEKKPEIY